MVTSPVPASVLRASRTGVLDTPSSVARSVSTSGRPGLSSPVRIACLIASSTASVRDGSAPGLDPAVPNRASGMGAPGGGDDYQISDMRYQVIVSGAGVQVKRTGWFSWYGRVRTMRGIHI